MRDGSGEYRESDWNDQRDLRHRHGSLGLGEYPGQRSTGSRGYRGNAGSCAESLHSQKTDPRADRTVSA